MDQLLQAGARGGLAFAASYAAILVLLGVVLAFRVVQVRRAKRIGIGDGGDKELIRRIRVHGNFSEYAPLLIGVLILLPLVGAREWLVHLVGVIGLTGRFIHAFGLTQSAGTSLGRVGGMVLTFIALGVGALAILVLAWR